MEFKTYKYQGKKIVIDEDFKFNELTDDFDIDWNKTGNVVDFINSLEEEIKELKFLISKLNEKNEEVDTDKELLLKNQLKREDAVEKYKDFLNEWEFKGKGGVGRKRLRCAISRVANTLYANIDDEYHGVSKFHRGMWSNCNKLFNEEDMITLTNFAIEYGAMDY